MNKYIKLFNQLPPNIRKFTVLFSLSRFLWYFNFFWLIQNIYFLESGINFTQLSIVLGFWSVGIILLELPSGAFADRYGRKLTIIISRISYLFGLLIFIIFHNFWGFIAGMLFWSINESFMSGAEEALLYDFLKDNKKENLFNKVLALSSVSREVGLGTGVLIAGFVTQISINYNLLGAVIIAALGILPTLFLEESRSRFSESPELNYIDIFKSGVKKVKASLHLQEILLFTVTSMLSYKVITEYFTVALYELDVDFIYIGVLALAESIFFALGGFISHKIENMPTKKVYIAVSICMVILIGFIGTASVFAVIIGYMLLRTVKAIGEIISSADWQSKVESIDRATSTSFISFSSNLAYVPMAFLFGKVADLKGLFPSYYLMAGLAGLYVVVEIILQKRRQIKH